MTDRSPHRFCIVIGAGLCGLSAAYHLEKADCTDYVILESSDRVGGLASTEVYDGFSFDLSIHILYTQDAYAARLISEELLAENLGRQARESYCYTSDAFTEYPYQANNFGLPAEVITENIMGMIEARYELSQDGPPAHFEEWIYRTFGHGIAKNFMIPYNRCQWAWDLKDMNYDWIAERVPSPKIKDVLLGALQPPEKKYGPNREFWYPIEGGIEALPQAFMQHVPDDRIRLGAEVVAIDTTHRMVTLADGCCIRYDWLISTLPQPELIGLLDDSVPEDIRSSAEALNHNVVHTVNIGLEGKHLGLGDSMHWVYFANSGTNFHRISFPHRFSPWMVPPGCCSIQAEISESVHAPCTRTDLIRATLEGLVQIGFLNELEIQPAYNGGRVRVAEVVTLNPAYVIYDLDHQKNTKMIKEYLADLNIETRGRFGEWEYLNMDQSIISGRNAVERILGRVR